MLLLLYTALLCACSSLASESCAASTFRTVEGLCASCTVCPPGQQSSPCQAFQDTICIPQTPVSTDEAHQRRLEEEHIRTSMRRAKELLHVEMTRMENLVYEWQISVFVISILVTFALVFSCFSMMVCRTRVVVQKGIEDYGHLLNKNSAARMDGLDQGTLAYADFDRTKIGLRSEDSPYNQLCSAVRPKASAKVSSNYTRLSQIPA